MKKLTQTASALIAVGCLIALCPLFFVTGYKPGADFLSNLLALKVWLIPYRFFLALGVLLIFVGIKKIADGP